MSNRGSDYVMDRIEEQLFQEQIEQLGRVRAERLRADRLRAAAQVRGLGTRETPVERAMNEMAADASPYARRAVTNTTAEMQASFLRPELVVASLLTGALAESIEAQEARGQAELVASTVLPARIYDDGKAALEAAGVVFGSAVKGDPMFVEVTLPAGWRKVATDHDMWSDLVDDLDRIRAGIFYKSAFYDRSAHMEVKRRYVVESESEQSDGKDFHERGRRAVVKDMGYGGDGRVIFATSWQFAKRMRRANFEDYWAFPEPEKEAQAWLAKHFPRCKAPSAYWNELGPKSRNEVKKLAAADARRLVKRESADVRSDDSYAQSSFQGRVSAAARSQIQWIAPQWREAYMVAFAATAEHDRALDAEVAKAAT